MAYDFGNMRIVQMKQFSRKILNHVKRDRQMFIAICGDTGIGKSVFAMVLAMLIDPKFSVRRNIMFAPTPEQVKQYSENLPEDTPIILDEAVKVASKWDWATRLAKELNKYTQVSRIHNKIYILCIPQFTDLNKNFRDITTFYIELEHRDDETGIGTGVIYARDWNKWKSERWNIDKNAKVVEEEQKGRFLSDFDLEGRISAFSKVRNFEGVIQWNNIDPEIYSEYKKYKIEATAKEIDLKPKGIGKRELKAMDQRNKLINMLAGNGMPRKEIAKMLNMTYKTVSDIIEYSE